MARPKGSRNLKTIEVEMTAKRVGCDPFEILCHIANGDWKALGYITETKLTIIGKEVISEDIIQLSDRLNAAKEACKYLFSQKRSVELSADEKGGLKIILEDYTSKALK